LKLIIRVVFTFFFYAQIALLFGQEKPIHIKNDSFNKKFLEHLIKIKIDSVRHVYHCKSLVNDSILYIASKHHADYMNENNRMSHFEANAKKTRTPQLRAEYFGAKKYGVGENVLLTPYNVVITTKNKRKLNTITYHKLAESIVVGWVNSPGHFKNIITPSYQITGVSVAINKEKNKLYACQKFAVVQHQYYFLESETLFPYSQYIPEKPINSFNGIEHKLKLHNHQWGLKHDDLNSCEHCEKITKHNPRIELKIKRGSLILYTKDAEYIKRLIRNKTDGFAVEIVSFDDYMCGNPAYYTNSSRRNGQCRLNGKVLKPLYRKELKAGFKKKKRNKEVKFFPFIFGSDSIRFFDRFARYKIEKYNSEYYSISLGRVPKNISSYWNYNLVTIQDNQICHINYLANYCGDLFLHYENLNFVSSQPKDTYPFQLDTAKYSYEIPFDKNNFELDEADIEPFIKSLTTLDYTIDSIHIKAFSSIEGDSLGNEKLQHNRAKSIVQVLEQKQTNPIHTKIQTATSWEHFYRTIKKNKKYSYLAKLNQEEILAIVNANHDVSLEWILKQERKAEIDMYCKIDLTDHNLVYYIKKELAFLIEKINKTSKNTKENKAFLEKYAALYRYIYSNVKKQKIDTSFLAKLTLPKHFERNIELKQLFILYGYEFSEEFNNNHLWFSKKDKWRNELIKNSFDDLSSVFIYNDCKIKTQALVNKEMVTEKQIQNIVKELNFLLQKEITFDTEEIEKLKTNLNMILLNTTYKRKPKEHIIEAGRSIDQIVNYYKNHGLWTKENVIRLAKMSVYYEDIHKALWLLSPFMDDETVLSYALPLYYSHPSEEGATAYYNKLKELSKTMKKNNWCNLFMNKCSIPFQSFDDEELRNIFCEKCQKVNDKLKQIMD